MLKILMPIIAGQARHILTAVGGIIVANGYATGAEWETISGAIILIGGMAFSAGSKWLAKRKLEAEKLEAEKLAKKLEAEKDK